MDNHQFNCYKCHGIIFLPDILLDKLRKTRKIVRLLEIRCILVVADFAVVSDFLHIAPLPETRKKRKQGRDKVLFHRGDTIHPSTLEVIYELGLIEAFLKRPHQEIREVGGQIGEEFIPLADLTHPFAEP